MTNTKPTPGPFEILTVPALPHERHFIIQSANGVRLGEVYHPENRALFVAAPDGLAFAQAFLDMASEVTAKGTSARPTVAQLNALYDQARALVAKTRGEA